MSSRVPVPKAKERVTTEAGLSVAEWFANPGDGVKRTLQKVAEHLGYIRDTSGTDDMTRTMHLQFGGRQRACRVASMVPSCERCGTGVCPGRSSGFTR